MKENHTILKTFGELLKLQNNFATKKSIKHLLVTCAKALMLIRLLQLNKIHSKG